MKLFQTEVLGVTRLSKERVYLTAMGRSFINPAKIDFKITINNYFPVSPFLLIAFTKVFAHYWYK